MTQFIGYIGTVTVTVIEETWEEDILILGEDPVHEAPENEFEVHSRASFVGAWRRAIKMIRDRGGVVINRPPAKPRPPKSRFAEVLKHVHGNTVSTSPIWYDDDLEFKNRRKARRYAKRHAKEITAAWNY